MVYNFGFYLWNVFVDFSSAFDTVPRSKVNIYRPLIRSHQLPACQLPSFIIFPLIFDLPRAAAIVISWRSVADYLPSFEKGKGIIL